jgi:hypothetical protein
MMLSKTTLLSKALPVMTTRCIIIQSSYPLAKRQFHISSINNYDSKASFATIAPEKSDSATSTVPPATVKEDKAVAKVDGKPLTLDIRDKRDFHWSHPVYTKEEYEAIQVDDIAIC